MHGNLLNKNKVKLFNTANSDLAARILILENNVYKITYYEIISGATGTLTVPTAATINANEFSGANCILSEIDVNNKPTWVSPKNAGGTVVTASLNTGTGAWVKSGVTVSANVALIYSLNIRAADYANLTNFYIVEETVIGDFSYVLNNTTIGTVTSTLLANAMSDETGSGALVFGTSPTFTTDITTPLIIGGSAVGSTIQYKGTSGNGTSTVAAHQFLVGTNGGTTAASIYNSGQVNIGNYASPNNQRLVTIGQDTAWLSFGSLVGLTSYAAIYLNQATPSTTNYTITSDGSNVYLNTQSTTGFCYITTGGNTRFYFGRSGMVSNFAADVSGATTTFSFITPAHSGQTASTEISNFKVTGNTKTWAAGTITTQRWNYFTANTAAFASASTITNSYGLYVEAATVGTNATITNNYAAGFAGNLFSSGSAFDWNAGSNVTIGTIDAKNFNLKTNNTIRGIFYGATGGLTIGAAGYATYADLAINASSKSSIAWTTNGIGIVMSSISYTDTTSSGTVANAYTNLLRGGNILASSATTYTDYYGTYFIAPTASTNVTITNNWGFGTTGGIKVNATANTVLGNAALATNATTGFLHVPSCAGTPTGVPTLFTGMIPVCADSTNNKLYIYSGGAWVALN